MTRPAEELDLRDFRVGVRQYQLLHHRLKAGLFQAPWEKPLSLELAPTFSAETCCGARPESDVGEGNGGLNGPCPRMDQEA